MARKLIVIAVMLAVLVGGWLRCHHHPDPVHAADEVHDVGGAAIRHAAAADPSGSDRADPIGTLRLEGQVLGPDGEVIVGANVTLAGHAPRTVVTEADGGFAFEHLAAGDVVLSAHTDEQISERITHQLTATSDPVVIRLARGGSINVGVRDDAGAPIANATVETTGMGNSVDPVAADAHGDAVLRPVRAGTAFVQAKAPGYATATVHVTARVGARTDTTVTLHKGVAVSGRVVDESGAPVAGASVGADAIDGPRTYVFDHIESETHGDFAITLAPGHYRLSARDRAHVRGTSAPIDVATAPVTSVTITMTAGGMMDGVVVDRDDHPVAGAQVRAIAKGSMFDGGEGMRGAVTGSDGRFELRGLARTSVNVGASTAKLSAKPMVVELGDRAAAHDVKLVLALAGTIAGTVVDDVGHPVGEVHVRLMPDILAGASMESMMLSGMSSAITDGAGAFAFHALDDGAFRLSASRDGAMSFAMEDLGTAAHTGAIDVKLVLPAPGVVIAKVVIDGGGAPTTAIAQLGRHGMQSTSVVGGALRIDDAQPGSYTLIVRGPEFAEHSTDAVVITAGKTTDLGTITVSRGRQLAGTVVDSAGQAVAGATIQVGVKLASDASSTMADDSGRTHTAVSAADGSFVVRGLPLTATHALADHATRGRSLAIDVPAGTDDPPPVTLSLHGFGSVAGKVTRRGKPVAMAMVDVEPQGKDTQRVTTMTATDGSFAFAALPEGPEVVNAMQIDSAIVGGNQIAVPVTIVAGQQANVAIEPASGDATLTVQLQPEPGAKVDAAYAVLAPGVIAPHNGDELEAIHGSAIQRVSLTPTAPMVFADLQPGAYTLCVLPITGSLMDPAFMKWADTHGAELQVSCQPVTISAGAAQTLPFAIGSMQPAYHAGS